MKSMYGLGLAIALGIAGALLNFTYLNMKARDVEKQYFIGIKDGVVVNRGEILQAEHIEPVGIPKQWLQGLPDYAVRYEARKSAIGSPVWRMLMGPTLLLADDLKTPPPQLQLAADEQAFPVPVEKLVPSLVNPGDQVSFVVPRPRLAMPGGPRGTEDDPGAAPPSNPPARRSTGTTEIVGPFRVVTVGNRLGSADVHVAAKLPRLQENILNVAVKVTEGELEPKAQKLFELLHAADFRGVGVLWRPTKAAP
jgi:hypothetical protein